MIGSPPPPRSPRQLLLVLLIGGALLSIVSPGLRLRSADAARGHRLILLGLHGADWLTIDPLVAAGKLPTLGRLKAVGRCGVLVSTPPLVSPIVWTTIATGRRPEDHRVQALWNSFSSAGSRVGIAGWWATCLTTPIRASHTKSPS